MGSRGKLKWVHESEGVYYMGIQIRFQLPAEANFDKLMISLKGKMIMWGNCNLSLAGKIFIANQVLLSSMWYMAAC
jgi:hypothetical protein